MSRLIMRRGPTPGAIYELERDSVALGRGSKNDIIIHDNEISREHCVFRRVMDDYEVQDLNSSNGTFVNGQRVQAVWLLQPGAIVEFGDTITMEYERIARKGAAAAPELEATGKADADTVLHYSLMMTMGPEMGQVHRLDSLIVTVGRDLTNDIVIQDPEISRFHMRLRRTDKGYSVEDMGSTNGTFVNGNLVEGAKLLNADDVIRLARQVRLQYVARPEPVKSLHDETIVPGSGENVRLYSARSNQAMGETSPLAPTGMLRAANTHLGKTTGGLRSLPKMPEPITQQTGRMKPSPQIGDLTDTLFVAYARPDWDKVVASLVSSLQQAGIQSWVDQYLVQHGDDWRASLEQALSECWAIVVVATEPSLASNYVKMAYRYFSVQDKPLITLLVEPEITLPPDLIASKSIVYDRANPQRSYHKLILELMHLRR
ncbi:MAG: FHA domain-containing protein [Chloroflexota bacterium]|nr:FHA domain-containing protein [Chloroflexota bacterium]